MQPRRALLLALPLLAALFAGCAHTDDPSRTITDRAKVETSHGCFVIGLYGDDAPKTVTNFLRYADEGFYTGTVFHRVMQGFMVQGGGFDQSGRQKPTHDPVPLEARIPNTGMTVAMARTADPDSATSQFYVNTADNDILDPASGRDGYTVFGKVEEGQDAVRAIETVPVTDNGRGERSAPLEPPVIQRVTSYGKDERPTCGATTPDPTPPAEHLPVDDCLAETLVKTASGVFAHFETTHGCFVAELSLRDAPRTVEHFRALVETGFYDGLAIHRVAPGVLVQMGGFYPDGSKAPEVETVPLEASRSNTLGTLAMARSPRLPDSATSQFFVNLKDNTDLDPGPTERGYTVFAKVVRGFGTLEHIAGLPQVQDDRTGSKHPDPVPVIVRATIVEVEPETLVPRVGLDVAPLQADPQLDGAHRVNVSGVEELVPLWLRNSGDREDSWTFSVQAPEGWTITPSVQSVPLEPAGSVRWTGEKPPYAPYYPDHGTILLAIGWSGAGTPAETDVTVRFTSTRDPARSAPLVLRLTSGDAFGQTVTKLADRVSISYDGRFEDGTSFDSGEIATTIGSVETVPGLSFGLAGLAVGEQAFVRIPPELGYGRHNPTGSGLEGFNGKWLYFAVHLDGYAQ